MTNAHISTANAAVGFRLEVSLVVLASLSPHNVVHTTMNKAEKTRKEANHAEGGHGANSSKDGRASRARPEIKALPIRMSSLGCQRLPTAEKQHSSKGGGGCSGFRFVSRRAQVKGSDRKPLPKHLSCLET